VAKCVVIIFTYYFFIIGTYCNVLSVSVRVSVGAMRYPRVLMWTHSGSALQWHIPPIKSNDK